MKSMTKQKTTISIDSEILKKSKKRISNLSEFIEDCLRNYLGERKHQADTSRMHELIETISKCQLELYIMNQRKNVEDNIDEIEKQKTWRTIFKEYRETRTIDKNRLKKASEKLEIEPDELADIIEVAFVYQDETIDITDWFEIQKKYGSE